MQDIYPKLPNDKARQPMQEYPAPVLAQARYTSENASASSVISVSHNTTTIEAAALGASAAIKWIGTGNTNPSVITIAGSTSNYDHIIPAGTYRRFALPIERQGSSAQSVQGVNRAEGLYQRVALISMGVGSVLLSEY